MKWALIYILLNSNTGEFIEAYKTRMFDSQEACEYYLYELNEKGPNWNYTLKRDDLDNLTLIDEDNVHRYIRACTHLIEDK